MKTDSEIILASGSSIRRELLNNAGVKFTVRTGGVDEDVIKNQALADGLSSEHLAQKLALAKAEEFPAQDRECIIGADQLLEFDGQVFDKPKNMEQARERFLAMRGKTHLLIGAIAVVQKNKAPWVCTTITKMHMREFSGKFLDLYLEQEGEKILSSVGGYMFEKRGAQLFTKIEGDYFSILGLSLLPLLEHLREIKAIDK